MLIGYNLTRTHLALAKDCPFRRAIHRTGQFIRVPQVAVSAVGSQESNSQKGQLALSSKGIAETAVSAPRQH